MNVNKCKVRRIQKFLSYINNYHLGNLYSLNSFYREVEVVDTNSQAVLVAWNAVLQRHLLSSYEHPQSTLKIDFSETNISHLTENEIQNYFVKYRYKTLNTEKVLNQEVIFLNAFKTQTNYRLIFYTNSFIFDLHSLNILVKDYLFFYNNKILEPLSLNYFECLMKQTPLEEPETYFEHWKSSSDTSLDKLNIPMKELTKTSTKVNFRTKIISNEIYKSLLKKANQHHVNTNTILLGLYILVLNKWSNNQQFNLNIISDNREMFSQDTKDIIGLFTVFDLIKIDVENTSIISLFQKIQNTLLALSGKEKKNNYNLLQQLDSDYYSHESPFAFTYLEEDALQKEVSIMA